MFPLNFLLILSASCRPSAPSAYKIPSPPRFPFFFLHRMIILTINMNNTSLTHIPVLVGTGVPAPARQQTLASLFSKLQVTDNSANRVLLNSTRSRLPLPIKSAIKTYPVLPERMPKSLPTNVTPLTAAAIAAKIEQRRQRVVANLQRPKQPTVTASRPVKSPLPAKDTHTPASPPSTSSMPRYGSFPVPAPSSIQPNPSMPSRVWSDPIVPRERTYGFVACTFTEAWRQHQDKVTRTDHITFLFDISDAIWNADTRIPAPSWSTNPPPAPREPKPAYVKTTHRFARVFITLKPQRLRGSLPYCPSRPHFVGDDGSRVVEDYRHETYYQGRGCECHGKPVSTLLCQYHGTLHCDCNGTKDTVRFGIAPEDWATTPAEEDVNPARPRKVKFADRLITSVVEVEKYIKDIEGDPQEPDESTEADDILAIAAIDRAAADETTMF